jgi:hypothetical protein
MRDQAWITALDTAGRWASTRIVLDLLGIDGVIPTRPVFQTKGIEGTADLELASVPPAGTHRHGIANSLAKRLANHPIAPLATVLIDCVQVAASMQLVMANPSRYHIGREC